MKKNRTGLIFVILGFFGILLFVEKSTEYAMNLNTVSYYPSVLSNFVESYGFQPQYRLTVLMLFVGLVLLLIEPITKLILLIKKSLTAK